MLTHLPCLKTLGVDGPALDVFVPGLKADTVEDALLLVDTGPVAAAADRVLVRQVAGREEGEGTSGLAWPPRDNVFGMVPNIDRRLPSATPLRDRDARSSASSLIFFAKISKSDSVYGRMMSKFRGGRLESRKRSEKYLGVGLGGSDLRAKRERERARGAQGTVGMSGMRVGALGRGTRRERGGETMSASACSRALRVAGGRPTRRVTSSRRLRAYDNSREGGQQDDSSADYGRERGEDLEEQRALDELRSEFAQVVKQVRTFSSAWQPAGCATHGERSDVAFYFSAQPYFIFDDDGLTPSFDPTFSLSHTHSLSLSLEPTNHTLEPCATPPVPAELGRLAAAGQGRAVGEVPRRVWGGDLAGEGHPRGAQGGGRGALRLVERPR